MAQENDPRQIVIFYHHCSVTLVEVACLMTQRSGGAELRIVARLLLCGEQLGPLGPELRERLVERRRRL